MAKKYCQGLVPECSAQDISADNPLKMLGSNLGSQVDIAYANLAFRDACEAIFNLVRSSNKYIDDLAPWTLFKQDKHSELAQVLYSVLESARLSAYLLSPIVPKISTDIYQQLGLNIDFDLVCCNNSGNDIATPSTIDSELPIVGTVSESWEHHQSWGILQANARLGEPQPIFIKLELKTAPSS